MDLNSIFNGIGTQVIILLVGIIFGVIGSKLYVSISNKKKQQQKAGSNSTLIQTDIGTINYATSSDKDEFDIRNFNTYTTEQIENVIKNGNNATRRKWCLELIIQNKADYLIQDCINKMDNNKEKYKLLASMLERQLAHTKFFELIIKSLNSDVDKCNTIKLLVDSNKPKHVANIFKSLSNEKYVYESLVALYKYDRQLFDSLYQNGSCFHNKVYKRKMKQWLF